MTSKSANLRFRLDGKEVDAPIEWEDITINASFDNGSIQANINTDSFTFANNEAKIIKDWINGNNIFKGLPFKIDAYNTNVSKLTYDGFVNCANNVEILESGEVRCNIQLAEGLNTLTDQLQGLTLQHLYSIGVIKDSDFTTVKYVVEKKLNTVEIITNLILGYILLTQLRQQIASTSTAIANAVGHATGGITGGVASIAFSIAVAIIELAYTVFMVSAIIKIGTEVFNMLSPISREHKTLNARTALTKICSHLGLAFNSNIPLLDTLHYLPSNIRTDDVSLLTGLIDFPKGTKTGIPHSSDYGYTAEEMFDIYKRMFNAKIQVKNNTLYFLWENDSYWNSSSSFVMPNILRPVKRYNTDELVFSKLFEFRTDEIADEWTLTNYKGTNYSVITDDSSIPNDGSKYIKGHETVNFNVALGSRKNELNALERSLSKFASVVDDTVNFFGGSSNLAGKIKNKVGALKVGTNNHTVPKILYLTNGSLPSNHRELFSAKTLYHTYLHSRSFVLNNYGYQKAIYEIEDLPFGFEDFLKTSENSIFTEADGKQGKFRSSEWLIAGDSANVEIENKEIYCTSLTETYNETE